MKANITRFLDRVGNFCFQPSLRATDIGIRFPRRLYSKGNRQTSWCTRRKYCLLGSFGSLMGEACLDFLSRLLNTVHCRKYVSTRKHLESRKILWELSSRLKQQRWLGLFKRLNSSPTKQLFTLRGLNHSIVICEDFCPSIVLGTV